MKKLAKHKCRVNFGASCVRHHLRVSLPESVTPKHRSKRVFVHIFRGYGAPNFTVSKIVDRVQRTQFEQHLGHTQISLLDGVAHTHPYDHTFVFHRVQHMTRMSTYERLKLAT